MRYATRWFIAALAAFFAIPPGQCAERPDLTGTVLAKDQKPVAGATVAIYTAGPRIGTATMCPSCYPDCAKTTLTDAGGKFTIRSLDPNLIFRVLVIAEAYAPEFVTQVDPTKGAIAAALRPMDPDRLKPGQVLRGRVLDPEAQPVFGASLSPALVTTDQGRARTGGMTTGIDPLVVSNARGEFAITTNEPGLKMIVKLEARGLITTRTSYLTVDDQVHTIQLRYGVTIRGRVVMGGKPIPGAAVGVVQVNRNAATFAGHQDIAVDDAGRFAIQNVKPDEEHYVYVKMDTLKSVGAFPPKKVWAGADRTDLDVGDLAVQPGFRVSGRLILDDGKPVPPGTRMQLSSKAAWDSQVVEVAGDGSFGFVNVPPERYILGVRVTGYRFSPRNQSLDIVSQNLKGRVSADATGLRVLLEPGTARIVIPTSRDAIEANNRVQEEPIRGIRNDK